MNNEELRGKKELNNKKSSFFSDTQESKEKVTLPVFYIKTNSTLKNDKEKVNKSLLFDNKSYKNNKLEENKENQDNINNKEKSSKSLLLDNKSYKNNKLEENKENQDNINDKEKSNKSLLLDNESYKNNKLEEKNNEIINVIDENANISNNEKVKRTKEKRKIRKNLNNNNFHTFKEKMYFNYETRLVFKLILFIFFLVMCLIFFKNSFVRKSAETFNYTDNGLLSYKVFVKDSDYYLNNYVEMDKFYIPNLISEMKFYYSYLLKLEKNSTIVYNYSVIQNFYIYERGNEKNLLYSRTDTYKNDNNKIINDNSFLNITDILNFDYNKYRSELQYFKNNYTSGVDGKVEIDFTISYNVNEYKISDSKTINVKIPLSDGIFTIARNTLDTGNHSIIIKPETNDMDKPLMLILSIISGVFTIISMYNLIKFATIPFGKSSNYVTSLNKILKDYDRVIVKTKDVLCLDGYKTIKVMDFNEMLDLRDNLESPILFTEIHKNQKSKFIIAKDNIAYIYTLKDNTEWNDKNESNEK